MLTINQVKQYLISFFNNHLQINTVVYDSDFNFNAEDDILYKVAQIQPVDPVQTSYNEVIYSFKVVIADIINPNNHDSENDIQSDCISIANDFISYFGDEDFQDFYFDKGISIQTFTEKNGDRIAGCVFAFGVRQTRLFNPCSIPLANPFTGVSFTGNVANGNLFYNLLAPYLTIVSASTLFQPKGNYVSGTTVDFSDYYTKEQANATFLTGYTPDLSNYYTKSQNDSKYQVIGNYVSASTLNNYQLAGNYVSASTLSNYLTASQISSAYQGIGSYVSASTLANYQLAGNYVSASTLNNYQLAGNYVSASTLANYQIVGNYVSASTLSNYLTASQISAAYQAAGNYVSASTLSSYLTSAQISASYQVIGNYVSASTLANYQLAGNYVSASTLNNYQLAGNYVSASTLAQYQPVISLTTSGNSGSATFNSPYFNIPTYTLAGLGGISLSALSASSPLSYNNLNGAFAIQSANTSQSGYLLSSDWNTFNNKQASLNGTGYAKFLGATASYIASIPNSDLANSTITIQGISASLGGSINVLNGTGFVKASGITISYDNTIYQPVIALTTSGTTGAATFDGINLNVPQYAGTTYSASNGISLTSSNFTLGGTLNQSTNTEMSGHTFKYTDTIGTDKFTVGNGAFNITEGVSGTGYSYLSVTHGAISTVTYLANSNDNFSFFSSNGSASINYAQNSSGTSKQIAITPTAIQIYDSVSLKGMTYSADYSANGKIDNRWIPDYGSVKSYVTGAISGITGGTSANPTALVSLIATTGNSTSFMRSDAAPAIDQTITPTWTGLHKFQNNSVGTTVTPWIIVSNDTIATSATTQLVSPALTLRAHNWQNSADKYTDMMCWNEADNYGTYLNFGYALTGATPTKIFQVSQYGDMQAFGSPSAGSIGISKSTMATTSSVGVLLTSAANAASAGVPVRYSPALNWTSIVWSTTSGTSNQMEFRSEVRPVSGGTPTGNLFWSSRLSSGGTGNFTDILNISNTGVLTLTAPVVTKGYTVATLPAGLQGMIAYVTDSNSTSVGTIVSGSGLNVKPVFYNGTNWVTM